MWETNFRQAEEISESGFLSSEQKYEKYDISPKIKTWEKPTTNQNTCA